MASRFWAFAANLIPGAFARAEHVNSKFNEVDGALLSIANELNRAIRFSQGPVPPEPKFQIGQTDAQRANLVLGFDALGLLQLRALAFAWRGPWAIGQNYAANDTIKAPASHFGSLYICVVNHASNDFAADLAAGRWAVMVDLTQVERSVRKFKITTGSLLAEPGDDIFANTSGGAFTITLPAAPSISDQPIQVVHAGGNASSNPITIDRNGKLIMGAASNLVISTTDQSIELSYADDALGWRVISKV